MWQNSILYRIISVSPKAVIASSQQEHPASAFLLSYTLALLTNGSLLLRYTQVCKFKYILWYLCSLNMKKDILNHGFIESFINTTPISTSVFPLWFSLLWPRKGWELWCLLCFSFGYSFPIQEGNKICIKNEHVQWIWILVSEIKWCLPHAYYYILSFIL